MNALMVALLLIAPQREYFQPGGAVPLTLSPKAIHQARAQAAGEDAKGLDAPAKLQLALLDAGGRLQKTADVKLGDAGNAAKAGAPGKGKDGAKASLVTVDLLTLFGEAGNGTAPPKPGSVGLWDGKLHYLQLLVDGKPMGTPLVVQPLKRDPMPEGFPAAFALRVFVEQYAVFETTEGSFTVAFDPAAAPNTAMAISRLVQGGFYTNIPFHRVLPGFVVQTGDPSGTGIGGPGFNLDLEPSRKKHAKGVVSMARGRDPNSAGSQFYVCLSRERTEHLDGGYTAFGDVVQGIETIDKIAATPLADPRAGTPRNPPKIKTAKLVPAPPRKVQQ